MNKTVKRLLIVTGVVIVFAVIGKKAGWIGGDEKTKVSAEKAKLRNITEVVSASGKIQPEVEVIISPDVSGEIVELTVKEGDEVKQGQLLARILPDIYQSYVDRSVAAVNSSKTSLQNSKARLVQVESQFEKAKLTFDRNKKMFDEKLISASDFEAIKSAYEVAEAEVVAARESVKGAEYGVVSSNASLKEAQDNLKKTTIFAPVDGTIAKLGVEKGERVVGTSQMAGTEMMTLANLNEMEVSVDVNENDIIRVKQGDTADVQVDAYLDKKFKGIVTEVANSANTVGTSVDQVTNFKVKVRILRDSYSELQKERNGVSIFNPGMSATVYIHTKQVMNAISVPIQAVTTRDTSDKSKFMYAKDEGAAEEESTKDSDNSDSEDDKKKKNVECVFVAENGKAKLITVKTGIQDNNYIQILSGIKDGQEVISAPYSAISRDLRNEMLIEVVKKDKLYEKK